MIRKETLVTVGASRSLNCGVRDYSTELDKALFDDGIDVRRVWMQRRETDNLISGLMEDLSTLRACSAASTGDQATILFHYSAFSMGSHGVPLLAPLLPLWNRLRGRRVVTVLHEIAYPWGSHGWKGAVWAISQRAALAFVLIGSDSVVVTTEERASWLHRVYRLPPERMTVIPVWSNIPPAAEPPSEGLTKPFTLGTFGWGHEGIEVELVVRAIANLVKRGRDIELLLVGSPGPESPAGRRWTGMAAEHGVEASLRFTGAALGVSEISAALARIDIFLNADTDGPTSRRTSLAAALSHGLPIVAFEGRSTWKALRPGSEVLLIPRDEESLARAICLLMDDEERRLSLRIGAAEAYAREMALETGARTMKAILFPQIESPR